MPTESFVMDGVEVTAECGTGFDLNDLKASLKGRVEFQDMVSSNKYLKALSILVGEVEKKKLDFPKYAKNFAELMTFKDQKLDGAPSLQKTVDAEYQEDRFLKKYKLLIVLKTTIQEKALPTYVAAYRALGFNLNDETTVTILGRFATHENRQGPPTFTTPESVVEYCKRWDLRRDRENVQDLANTLTQVLNSKQTTTEGGEEFKVNVRRFIKSEVDDFQKRSADPFMLPSGHMGSNEIADTHLAATLNDIAEEAHSMKWPQGSSIWDRVPNAKISTPVAFEEAAISKNGLVT
jgi:hypothetical protein